MDSWLPGCKDQCLHKSSDPQLVARPSAVNYMMAPVTGNDVGIRRAEIKQGIREIILCKDQDGKIGLRLKSVDNVCMIK